MPAVALVGVDRAGKTTDATLRLVNRMAEASYRHAIARSHQRRGRHVAFHRNFQFKTAPRAKHTSLPLEQTVGAILREIEDRRAGMGAREQARNA